MERVKQGDPHAGLLFALSMKDVYQQTLDAHNVSAVAIMDDLTIVGQPEDVFVAIDTFTRLALAEHSG